MPPFDLLISLVGHTQLLLLAAVPGPRISISSTGEGAPCTGSWSTATIYGPAVGLHTYSRASMVGTLYDVLGVAPGVSAEALREAHRQRVRAMHPDVATGNAEAMRALNGAWAVLSDPSRRAAYDRSLEPGPTASDDEPAEAEPPRMRVRLWPFLVLGAVLLVVLTAYAGRPADTRTQVEPVGRCLVEGADVDRTEPCTSPGGRRIVAVGGPGARCPDGSHARALRADPDQRTACVSRVAGR